MYGSYKVLKITFEPNRQLQNKRAKEESKTFFKAKVIILS